MLAKVGGFQGRWGGCCDEGKEELASVVHRCYEDGNSKDGIEKAKNEANKLFSQGKVEEAVRWFSKGIWVAETHVKDAPADMRSILHSNRSFACIKLKRWAEAEEDCSAAMAINSTNTKAKYRRAMARFELGKLESALQDVETTLKELPSLMSPFG